MSFCDRLYNIGIEIKTSNIKGDFYIYSTGTKWSDTIKTHVDTSLSLAIILKENVYIVSRDTKTDVDFFIRDDFHLVIWIISILVKDFDTDIMEYIDVIKDTVSDTVSDNSISDNRHPILYSGKNKEYHYNIPDPDNCKMFIDTMF